MGFGSRLSIFYSRVCYHLICFYFKVNPIKLLASTIFTKNPAYIAIRDDSGQGESGYSSKPAPFRPGMDYTYWTVDVYGDTRINPRRDGGGDGLTLTPAPYPPRPRYQLNK